MPASKNENVFHPRVSAEALNQLLDQVSQVHASYKERSMKRIHQDAKTRSGNNGESIELRTKTNDDDINNSARAMGPRIATKIKQKIVDKVSLNRLTIIIGPTGSGKSTQVPPLLQKGIGGCILCTQPRRLAVAAIAKRVAIECGVELGGQEVGFHVGNHNLSTHKTKLLFTTAGILLEELRANGSNTFSRFRVVLIDECHERSPESDLVLALIKQYMKLQPKAATRFVLMSATFRHERYAKYFSDVPGCQVVDTITLETADTFQAWYRMVDTLYLEDIVSQLPDAPVHQSFVRMLRINPDSDIDGNDNKSVSQQMLSLIRSLVQWLDQSEPLNSLFLVFAPTYRQLEQLYDALITANNGTVEISVLHSSIDTDECLRSMTISNEKDHIQKRRILLASAIADSSVTIPGVSCVIDLCRSLELRWSLNKQTYSAKTIWSSQSVCDQRRGRTGRTCSGRVFRLVHSGFFISRLPQWENPQLTISSCHDETLALICAPHELASKDPRNLLDQCLDPPSAEAVDDAISFLVEIGACTELTGKRNVLSSSGKQAKSKLVATPYGKMLSVLPMSLADAKVVLAGGRLGLIHEIVALRVIYNHKPAPIIHFFHDSEKNQSTLESFYHNAKANDTASTSLAHLCAYMFWDAEWNGKRRRDAMAQFEIRTAGGYKGKESVADIWKWTPDLEENHFDWCKKYDINPTSVKSIAEIIENTMNAFFLSKFEPEWLRCADPTPAWKAPLEWKGILNMPFSRDMLGRVYGSDAHNLCEALSTLCGSNGDVAAAFKYARLVLDIPVDESHVIGSNESDEGPVACIHFLLGNCDYGNTCRSSHSPYAKRPPCRFFITGTCTKGKACLYAHNNDGNRQRGQGNAELMLPRTPLRPNLHVAGGRPELWFMQNQRTLLLLGEGDFRFSDALGKLGYPPFLSSTDSSGHAFMSSHNRLQEVDASRLHMDQRILYHTRNSGLRNFAWNFPFTGNEEDATTHENLILETLQSVAQLLVHISKTTDKEHIIQFAMALHSDQFSRWRIIRSIWRVGWRLKCWSNFDCTVFPGYQPCRLNGDAFPVEHARFYVFQLTLGEALGSHS